MILFSFLQREEVKSLLYENMVRSRKGGITTENGHITTKTSFCLFSCQCRAHRIMFHVPKTLPVSSCTCFVPTKRAVSWAAEGRTAPRLQGGSTTAPTALAALTTRLLNHTGNSILTFTHPGQFLFVYFWLSVSGMPLFLIMKNRFGLFLFRLAVWRRFIDPGIEVQTGKNCGKQIV